MVEAERRGSTLLAIAREAIAMGLDGREGREWDEPWLRARAATFVTLRLAGDLRGCIGSVDAHRALGDDVAHNAHAAACRDPRFPPVPPADRERLEVEVSVLSARELLEVDDEAEAVACLRPGIDGVLLEYAEARATFLPQVWTHLPDPIEFLAELRRKARLPARFWHRDIRLSRYTVDKFR